MKACLTHHTFASVARAWGVDEPFVLLPSNAKKSRLQHGELKYQLGAKPTI